MQNLSESSFTRNYCDMLRKQAETSSKHSLDFYCEPLYWYVKFCCKRTSLKMQDIAKKMHMDPGLLTKKLNINNAQHRELTVDDIEELCTVLDVSLILILFLYENRISFEDSPEAFDNLTKLKAIGLTRLFDNATDIEAINNAESLDSELDDDRLLASEDDTENTLWNGKWYFYTSSSSSDIVKNRQKKHAKSEDINYEKTDDENELLKLYSNDHIYCGTIMLSYDYIANHYAMQLRYMTNPQNKNILQYDGIATASQNENALFASLRNQEDGDVIYLIIDKLFLKTDVKYIMASVLTLSKSNDEWHRRPCSMRMIMSRDIIPIGSPSYRIMESNLMMNDSVIRIDDHGYGELKKLQSFYACPALDRFLELYPDISIMEESSNFITVHKCAYISEVLLSQLKDLNPSDKLYLEAILRLHSTAPWYSKAKATKTNEILSNYEEDTDNDTK